MLPKHNCYLLSIVGHVPPNRGGTKPKNIPPNENLSPPKFPPSFACKSMSPPKFSKWSDLLGIVSCPCKFAGKIALKKAQNIQFPTKYCIFWRGRAQIQIPSKPGGGQSQIFLLGKHEISPPLFSKRPDLQDFFLSVPPPIGGDVLLC